VLLHTISEHVENAGVHSGDATLMLPPQTISAEELALCKDIMEKLAKALAITGPFNMQLIAKDGAVKVIECNLRASRSFPFSSKVLGVNFIETATKAMIGTEAIEPLERNSPLKDFVGVKAPMFSFQRLKGADPSLGVEMASTGELACFGPDKNDAFLKAMMSTGMKLPKSNILVSIQERERNDKTLPTLAKLSAMGYHLYATEKTAQFLSDKGVHATLLHYKESEAEPCIDDVISRGDIHLVLMFSNQFSERILTNYAIRRLAVDYGVPLITNIQVAEMFANSLEAAMGGAGSAGSAGDGEADFTGRGNALDERSLHEWHE